MNKINNNLNDNLYKELSTIKILDAETYSRLLIIYGEELVNKTIEQMIDDNSRNLVKFDYYISKIISYDNTVSKSSFDLYGMDLVELPDFSKIKVRGDFSCHYNKLTALKGAPSEVGGDFECSYCELTSLEGAPKKVGKTFWSIKNKFSIEDIKKVVKVKQIEI